jgi:hypothetical protein
LGGFNDPLRLRLAWLFRDTLRTAIEKQISRPGIGAAERDAEIEAHIEALEREGEALVEQASATFCCSAHSNSFPCRWRLSTGKTCSEWTFKHCGALPYYMWSYTMPTLDF